MNLLFLSYWGIMDPLTISTVLPHVTILSSFNNIEKIILVTIERTGKEKSNIVENRKVKHIPLHSKNFQVNVLNKIADFVVFPRDLIRIVKKEKIDCIIARGTPAGSLAYLVNKKTDVPFYVESFEPHADYMLESGVWKLSGLKYKYQKSWELKQMTAAKGLLPVARNYAEVLKRFGVKDAQIKVLPCCVSVELFQFSAGSREKARTHLGLNPTIKAGIYAGKFGGLYYDEEAFAIFKTTMDYFKGDFYLIILSPDNRDAINEKLKKAGVPLEKTSVLFVPHHQVPEYLSAADFAFALYKPSPSKKYLSPVKIGEYWANGLPVLCPPGIGDDSDIILNENGGAIFTLIPKDIEEALHQIEQILKIDNYRNQIKKIAEKHRSYSIAKDSYEYFFKEN